MKGPLVKNSVVKNSAVKSSVMKHGAVRLGLFALSLLLPLAARAEQAEATATISNLDNGLTAAMKAGKTSDFKARFDALAPVIDKSFDLPTILRNAVGLRWGELPAAQQKSLLDAFRAFTIATYVANFNNYNGTHFQILPAQRTVGSDVVVETQVVPPSGDPTRIDYLMHQDSAGWQVVDVLLESTISQVAVWRSDFRSLLAPGDASRLIADLQNKTAQLAGGTAPG